jgi:3-oxoacid CoA-transferase B subunit
MPAERLDERAIALRVAKEFGDGMVVNLGVGMPTLCANLIATDKEVIFHSENGLLGFGEIIEDRDRADANLINAGGQPVAARPGMAIVDHAESFAVVRGGYVDVTVLGAFQVSERGDLANYMMPGKQVGSLGGAQDLATCAKRVIVAMTHTDRDGRPKIVKQCSIPVTAPACVHLIVTDIAVIEVTERGLLLTEVVLGWTPEEVQHLTEPGLIVSPNLKEVEFI